MQFLSLINEKGLGFGRSEHQAGFSPLEALFEDFRHLFAGRRACLSPPQEGELRSPREERERGREKSGQRARPEPKPIHDGFDFFDEFGENNLGLTIMKDLLKSFLTIMLISAAFVVGFQLGKEKEKQKIPKFQEDHGDIDVALD